MVLDAGGGIAPNIRSERGVLTGGMPSNGDEVSRDVNTLNGRQEADARCLLDRKVKGRFGQSHKYSA